MSRENQIIENRMKKIEELRNIGINPYPHKFDVKNYAFELHEKYKKLKNDKKTKDKVSIAGRVMIKRDMGKISFATLQDSSGKIQIISQEKETPKKIFEMFKKYVDTGDFIGINGNIIKTKSGELSILIKRMEILSKAILPLPEKWHGLIDKEERYRKRYLDLVMNSEVKNVFLKREKIINIIRNFLKERRFNEVETPALQSVYGGASATPFKTHLNALDIDLFLSISPELYLKRLIVGGFEKVFTIGKNFRNEGIDSTHNPEFTMMEFYIAYADYEYLMKITEDLIKEILNKLKIKNPIEYQGKKLNFLKIKRLKFIDIVKKEIGIDITRENNFDRLKNAIYRSKINTINVNNCKHYGALLDELYKRTIRPKIIQPTFLTHYPVEMIALAKRNQNNPRIINTFQLIVDGAEIVKAYDELNDPLEQNERLKEQAKFLHEGDKEAMPIDEDFITALKVGMPPTAGYGLGIDRLTMILTNQPSIRDVILFPFMKPEGNK
ncbi:MAG: lysine--tRNA ligase [Candidatus Pacearchaeota archaeon]